MELVAEKQILITENTDNQVVKKEKDKLSNYIRVGGKFYKNVLRPDKNGKLHSVLIDWSRSNLMDDFGAKELTNIKKYDGSVRVPSHTNYQSEIGGFRNDYFKLTHEPKKGNFPTISQILNHVFQDKINFGLDYFQLLYTKPSQRLPILLLESNERNTGKSTLGELLCLLFQENAIPLGNSDFESDFSGFWLSKLCIIVDETSLDKRGIMQTIKRLSTAKGNVVSNEKNKGQKQIDFYGKFIFMSNDEGNALPIERGEDRFAVFKVPTLHSAGLKKIPDVEKLIISEIPAFIDFLINRKMVHPEKDRMYFELEVYRTPQLMLYYQNSSSHIAKEIKQLVKDTFDIFPEEKELYFSVVNIFNELKGTVKNVERSRIINVLKNEFRLDEPKRIRYTYHSRILSENSPSYFPVKNAENNNCYVFKRENY